MIEHKLTREEDLAIKALRRLAKRWPKTLSLFSCSGTLCVMRETDACFCEDNVITAILGIKNDGGDK